MKTHLTLNENGVVDVVYYENGTKVTKSANFADVADLFLQAVEKNEPEPQTDWIKLPFHPDILTAQVTDNQKNYDIFVDFKPQVLQSVYEDSVFNVPYPRLVFRFSLKRVTETVMQTVEEGKEPTEAKKTLFQVTGSVDVAAVKEKGELKQETELYHYPYTNVSGTAMCTGGRVKFPEFDNLSEVVDLPRFILTIPNNDHHYQNQSQAINQTRLSPRELLIEADELEIFPDEWLSPLNMTLEKFIENNRRNFSLAA